jgi:alpha-mannosidase
LEEALRTLGFGPKDGPSESYVALNTLPWPRKELIQLPTKAEKPKYAIAAGNVGIVEVADLVATTYRPVSVSLVRKGVFILENSHLRLILEDGVITSLYDVTAKREIIATGQKANQFVLFDDKPIYWQAWDVEVYHLESRQELKPTKSYVAEDGPHRVSVVTETKISEHSWLKSTVSLDAVMDDKYVMVKVETEVEWKETMKFLKVEFPVDIVNTEASYETQFGIVRRPTHYNTTWDMAKFEVCCHKWADLSEAGYGVSILNDSKYGFATCGNLMRLSLLRSPKAPDAHADMGKLFCSLFLQN